MSTPLKTKKMIFRHGWLLLTFMSLLLGLAMPICAQSLMPPTGIDASRPEPYVTSLMQQGVSLLQDANRPKTEKESSFRQILRTCFDLNSISLSALGAHKRGQPKELLNKYKKYFEAMIFRVYMDQLEQLTLHEYKVISVTPLEGEGQKVTTSVHRAESNEPINVEWIVFPKEGRYWVYDVIVGGVQLSGVQAREISALLTSNGGTLEGLVEALEKKFGKDRLE